MATVITVSIPSLPTISSTPKTLTHPKPSLFILPSSSSSPSHHLTRFLSITSRRPASQSTLINAVSAIADPDIETEAKPKIGKAALPLKRDRRRSKRFLEIQKLRESKKEYDVSTALSLLKQMANSRFVESVEAHFRLNIDPKYNDQQLRATVGVLREFCS